MKKVVLIALALGWCTVISCSSKKTDEKAVTEENLAHKEGWRQMDDFHVIMAETFHPYKDSSNLEPVKKQVKDLVQAMEHWINSPIPEKMNNDAVKSNLKALNEEVKILAEKVNTATDDEISSALTNVHNRFHLIQESWYGESEHHEH